MHYQSCYRNLLKHLALLPVLSLLFSAHLGAQPFGGGGFGGGGFGGGGVGGGGQGNRARNTATRVYPSNGTVGDAIISVDPETRSVVVIADDDTSKYISEVISNLDRPKPQVLIKVVFLELQYNNASDIGVEGTFNKNVGNSWLSGLTTNFNVLSNTIVPTSILPATASSFVSGSNLFGPGAAASTLPATAGIYQIMGQEFTVTLHAIAQAGKAKVLSRPSVIARNNQPATISVGQSVPLTTSVRYDTLGNAISGITYTSVGIILQVTPFITPDGLVEMILAPQTSELADSSQWIPISTGPSGSIKAPVINSRQADTVVVTPDGQTVIIGGLIFDSKAEAETKIPLLGDIPLLGNLFKRKSKTDSKTELLIFLTPHVIQAPTELAALSEREREKAKIQQSYTEQELNKFLDDLPRKDHVRGKNEKPNSGPVW
jgi:general secretion pathway protein D